MKNLGGHVPASRDSIGLVRNQSTHQCSVVGTSPCWGLLFSQPCQPEHHAPEAHLAAAANCGPVVRGAWLPPFSTRWRAHKALQWHRPTAMISTLNPISLTTRPIILYQNCPISVPTQNKVLEQPTALPSQPIFLYHNSAEKVTDVRLPNS